MRRNPLWAVFVGAVCLFALAGWWSRARRAEITLVAVGDLMLARGVAPQAASRGWDYPFAQVRDVIRSADIAVGNLECVLGERGLAVPKRFNFSAPEEAAGALKQAGFDLLFLANNHTLDRGRPGLLHTLELLEEQGIAWAGAGRTPRSARQAVVLRRKGLKVAFLAYTRWLPENYLSLPNRPGIAFADQAVVQADIRRARGQADLLIVSFHWGREHSPIPTASQRRLAHLAIEAGADLVLGHHPHVRQTVECYRKRPIFYSLGDFVFDQRLPRLSNGWLALLRLNRAGITVERLAAVEIRSCQPRFTWRPAIACPVKPKG